MICLMFNYLNFFRIFPNGFCTLKTNKTTPHNVIIRFVRRYFLLIIFRLRDKGFCWLMPSPLSRLTRVSKTVQKRGNEYVNEFNWQKEPVCASHFSVNFFVVPAWEISLFNWQQVIWRQFYWSTCPLPSFNLQRLRKKWKIYDWLTRLVGMKTILQNMQRFSCFVIGCFLYDVT